MSSDPLIINLPLLLTATVPIAAVCPVNIVSGFFSSISHIIILLSLDPLTIFLPSGVTATAKT